MSIIESEQVDSSKLIIPRLAGLYQSVVPYSYPIIRFVAGTVLIHRGYDKLFGGNIGIAQHAMTPLGLPDPIVWAYFFGLLELVGGALLAVGFLTRPIALMLTIVFLVKTFYQHAIGYTFGGYEYSLLLTVVYAAIFFRGAGRYSIDGMIGREL